MGIFDRIKATIWGQAQAATPAEVVVTNTQPASETVIVKEAAKHEPLSEPHSEAVIVNIDLILDNAAAKSGQKLNWRKSIVDLMKALGFDSGLEHRKELARELGFKGDMSDSVKLNIWLHKQVIQKLKENGGKVTLDL